MSNKPILTFDSLELKKQAVSIGGKNYTLTELDGHGRDKYQQYRTDRTKFEDGKFAGVKYEGLTTHLISLCLTDDKGVPVDQETLNKWPARITEGLFKAASEISGLGAAEEAALKEKAKNA